MARRSMAQLHAAGHHRTQRRQRCAACRAASVDPGGVSVGTYRIAVQVGDGPMKEWTGSSLEGLQRDLAAAHAELGRDRG